MTNWIAERRKAFAALVGAVIAVATTLEFALPEGVTLEKMLELYDAIGVAVVLIVGLVYRIPNKSLEDRRSQLNAERRRVTDPPRNPPLKSIAWLAMPCLAAGMLISLSGCIPDSRPIATKEETLYTLGLSIEALSNQVIRKHEQGSIDAGDRSSAGLHLQMALDAGVVAEHALENGDESSFYIAIQAAHARLRTVRSMLQEAINEPRSTGIASQPSG